MEDIQGYENVALRTGGKATVINELDFLTAPSNRRLSVKNIDTPLTLTWSIDRITIVGTLKTDILFSNGVDVYSIDFEQLMRINEGSGYVEAVGQQAWQIRDEYGENIAYIEILKFQKGQGRIDFNPNKISQFLADDMKHFIHKLFVDPHFSRADIACDILDVPDNYIVQYRMLEAVSYRPYFGRGDKLETAYWGSRNSEKQVRMYNKKLEQSRKRKIVPKEISTWWRLELQLRRGKASDWFAMVQSSLNNFVSPLYLPTDISSSDRVMISGLLADQNNWSLLSRPTKYKYQNLLKNCSKNDELTQALKQTFVESSDKLKTELDTWLVGLDVSEKE